MNIKLLIGMFLVSCVPTVNAASIGDYQFKGAELFSSENKVLTNREVPLGPMILAHQETNERTEGYHPQQAVLISGNAKVRVFDFNRQYSVVYVAQLVEEILGQRGYTIRYRCQEQACGELIGWRALLSQSIDGVEGLQQVIVASKINNNLSVSYVVGHVTDIDNQPRLVMQTIEAAAPIKWPSEQVLTLHFEVNSADLSDVQKGYLADIADVIQRDSTDKYKITGFADNQGDEKSNLTLSEARARTVAKLLIEHYGVPAEVVEVKGLGESNPLRSNNSSGGRAANRRVELTPVRL